MQSIDVVGTLRRGWRLLVALALVFAVVAVLLPQSTPAKKKGVAALHWQASTIVGSAPTGGSGAVGGGVTPAQLVYYAELYSVRLQAVKRSGLNIDPALLGYYMQAQQATSIYAGTATSTTAGKVKKNSGTGLVQLIALGKTGKDAVKLSGAYATELGDYVNNVAKYRAAGAAQGAANGGGGSTTQTADTGYTVIVPAFTATHVHGTKASITASRKVRLIIGLVIGLLIGAGILLLREVLDRRIRDAGGALKAFGYPVVIEIPAAGEGESDLIAPPASAAAEAYRRLRMSISFEHLAEAPGAPDELATFFGRPVDEVTAPSAGSEVGRRQLVLVASPDGEASRPRVAANLAASYAEGGQSVVVLSTSELPNLPAGALPPAQALTPVDVEAQLAPTVLPGVRRLPLDGLVGSSGQLATRAPALLEALRSVADIVVIETPSLLEVHHAGALSAMVDTVLLVAEVGATTTDEGAKTGELLQRLGAPVLGVALTEVPVKGRSAPAGRPASPRAARDEDDDDVTGEKKTAGDRADPGHGTPPPAGVTAPAGVPESMAD